MTDRVAAIVIAAGESRRMGEPKQLLPWGNQTIIEHVVGTLQQAPVDEIVVVLGHRANDIAAKVPSAAAIQTVINPRYAEGMLTSIQCGVMALDPGVRAAFIVLVDQPQLKASTVYRLREVFAPSGKGIIVPSHQMRRGHPLLIDLVKYREEILAIDGAPGLQKLLRDHPDDILHVEFEDASVLADLDSPADYQAAIRKIDRD